MKKIDLHIHTVPTYRDSSFSFDLNSLKRYVSDAEIDVIAITNHDMFDCGQFKEIKEALDMVVFPGIEVTLESGHILIIDDGEDLNDFEGKANDVAQRNTKIEDSISVEELEEIFGDLSKYLVIPHFDKNPPVNVDTLSRIADYVSAGEVDSAKKFIRVSKDAAKLTPVLFSDVRISHDLVTLPTRQTFIDCGELTVPAIKACLQDKEKVVLSKDDGNNLYQIFEDGQKISTGLNVLLGGRSSGKTVTLNRIDKLNANTKYIKQFSLVQQEDDETYKRQFDSDLQRDQSRFIEDYLSGFKRVLDDVINIDLRVNDRSVEKYVSSLLKAADEADRSDAFSKAALFDESKFTLSENSVLKELIESVKQVIENLEHREIITKHIDIDSLNQLICELIELLREKTFDKTKKELVNELVVGIKRSLNLRSSANPIEGVDLYQLAMDKSRVDRFEKIVKCIQRKTIISDKSIQGFRVVVEKGQFAGAREIGKASSGAAAFTDAFKIYGNPYEYLQELKINGNLKPAEFYKLFVKMSPKVLNKDGVEVSGGERSEFRLLGAISDAQNFDILLIDEPESSFDNMFLNSDVNKIIKDISKIMPVVVVTHNSTVGASIGADYLLYASKEREGDTLVYKLYSGHPTDRELKSLDGSVISAYEKTLNALEAGLETYKTRGGKYEAIKD